LTNFNLDNGASVGLASASPAASGRDSQQWVLVGDVIILAANPRFCLDVNGGNYSDWNSVTLYERHGGENQSWIFEADGAIKCKKNPAFCLVVRGPDFDKNALSIVTYTGSDEQKWRMPQPKSIRNGLLDFTDITAAVIEFSVIKPYIPNIFSHFRMRSQLLKWAMLQMLA